MNRSRQAEHAAFLDWLVDTIRKEKVDALVVAGDIFDTGTPPNYALELFYDFCARLVDTGCQAVFTAGNHDSPATLRAPSAMLRRLGITIIGEITGDHEDMIVPLKNRDGAPGAILCAVPFIRDGEVRRSVPGESYQEKQNNLLDGMRKIYAELASDADTRRKNMGPEWAECPIISTGHLHCAGGPMTDEQREIYVGSLGAFHATDFPALFDYVALGHIHTAYSVDGSLHVRYSGTPFPLSFSELENEKSVTLVELGTARQPPKIRLLPVPIVQDLELIRGDLEAIRKQLAACTPTIPKQRVWIEVQVTEPITAIQSTIETLLADRPLDLLALRLVEAAKGPAADIGDSQEELAHLQPPEVFERRLEVETALDPELVQTLRTLHAQVLQAVERSEEAGKLE